MLLPSSTSADAQDPHGQHLVEIVSQVYFVLLTVSCPPFPRLSSFFAHSPRPSPSSYHGDRAQSPSPSKSSVPVSYCSYCSSVRLGHTSSASRSSTCQFARARPSRRQAITTRHESHDIQYDMTPCNEFTRPSIPKGTLFPAATPLRAATSWPTASPSLNQEPSSR